VPLHDSILIERRFCGPPASANGGYAAGRLAAALGEGIEHPVQVRLHRPPPLDVPLTVNRQAADTAQLTNRGELVATATRTNSDPPPFAPASLHQAELASQPLDPDQHPFPHCFVCGPLRQHRDGLRIFPGPIPHTDIFAAAWTPDQNLSSNGNQVPSEFVWAALDCASGVPLSLVDANSRPCVLATITVRLRARPALGEPHVVTSKVTGIEGRKRFSQAMLSTADGAIYAMSSAIWIELATPIRSGPTEGIRAAPVNSAARSTYGGTK